MLNRMQSPEQMGFIETLLESTGNSSAFNHSTSHAVIRLRDLDASCFFKKKPTWNQKRLVALIQKREVLHLPFQQLSEK